MWKPLSVTCALCALCALVACAGAGATPDDDEAARKQPRPHVVDASTDPLVDAGGTSGVVACYTQTQPNYTCAAPQHCCFTNYSAQHNGECTSSACAWGTIDCDGPEDCAAGQTCCAHAIIDPDNGLQGYRMTCQAASCGPSPANEELCHTTATCTSGSCVSGSGANNDLPRALSICR